jgi:hypothetical protein
MSAMTEKLDERELQARLRTKTPEPPKGERCNGCDMIPDALGRCRCFRD